MSDTPPEKSPKTRHCLRRKARLAWVFFPFSSHARKRRAFRRYPNVGLWSSNEHGRRRVQTPGKGDGGDTRTAGDFSVGGAALRSGNSYLIITSRLSRRRTRACFVAFQSGDVVRRRVRWLRTRVISSRSVRKSALAIRFDVLSRGRARGLGTNE